jgi:hypothetical protein
MIYGPSIGSAQSFDSALLIPQLYQIRNVHRLRHAPFSSVSAEENSEPTNGPLV